MTAFTQRIMALYSVLCSLLLVTVIATGFARPRQQTFEEITVHRINIVEPDGTLRMVISNHARLPGVIVRGKEQPADRPQAGMIFYNDEGSENGGLIFGGRKNSKGEVVDSGGSLSFDRYDASQIVQLAGVNDKADRFAGLMVADSSPGGNSHRRIWVGRSEDGAAVIELRDAAGRKRMAMEVPSAGDPRIVLMDKDGKEVRQIGINGSQ